MTSTSRYLNRIGNNTNLSTNTDPDTGPQQMTELSTSHKCRVPGYPFKNILQSLIFSNETSLLFISLSLRINISLDLSESPHSFLNLNIFLEDSFSTGLSSIRNYRHDNITHLYLTCECIHLIYFATKLANSIT